MVDPSGLEGLVGQVVSFAISNVIEALPAIVAFRAAEAAWKVARGAALGAALQEAAVGVLSDAALSIAIPGVVSLVSRIAPVRAVGQALVRAADSVWNLGNFARGWAIESRILQRARTLADNFPVIDDFTAGVATSIKSIDLTAKTYQSIGKLIRKISGYAEELASFETLVHPTRTITSEMVERRVLTVAIEPGAATIMQAGALESLLRDAKSLWPNIDIMFVPVP